MLTRRKKTTQEGTKVATKLTTKGAQESVPSPVTEAGRDVEVSQVQAGRPPLAWLTLEIALYAGLFILAAALRLWSLGAYPLSNAEAEQSLLAMALYQGGLPEAESYSPLLVSINTITFLLFGASDISARLAAVLPGLALVILPFTLRRHLGTVTCLIASVLLAISPVAIFLSRTLNGEIAVATGALMLVAGFLNWAGEGEQHWLLLAAAGLALMLVAGPMAYSVLLVFALIVLLKFADFKALWSRGLGLSAKTETAPSEVDDRQAAKGVEAETPDSEGNEADDLPGLAGHSKLRGAGIFLLVTVILLATTATFNLSGFGVAATFLIDWLSLFGLQTRSAAGFNAVFLLTIYEPLLVFAGLSGIAYAILRQELSELIFVGWFIGLLLLDVVMGGRPNGSAILPLVPLSFLAAMALAELWAGVRRWGTWGNEGILLAVGLATIGFGYIGLTGWLDRVCGPDDRICQYGWLQAVAALILFLVVTSIFEIMSVRRSALRGAALTGVVVGLLAMISIGWRLNYGLLMNLAYQPLAGIPASTELVELTETLADQSEARVGDGRTLATTLVGPTNPALRWRLRDHRNLNEANSVFESPLTTAVITSPETGELAADTPYIGQDFAVDAIWSPVGLPPKQLINWLIFRETEERPQGNKAVLWLRLDGS